MCVCVCVCVHVYVCHVLKLVRELLLLFTIAPNDYSEPEDDVEEGLASPTDVLLESSMEDAERRETRRQHLERSQESLTGTPKFKRQTSVASLRNQPSIQQV